MYYVYFAFAIVGVLRPPGGRWWPIGVPLLALPLLYAPFSVDRRFFVPAIPLFMIFTARGVETARAWLEGHRVVGASVMGRAVLMGAVLFGVLYPFAGRASLDDAPEHRAAGEWLESHWKRIAVFHPPGEPTHPRPVVMSRKPWVAFYSGGFIAELPEGGLATVLDRARRKQADVLVIDERWISTTRPELIPLLDPAQALPGLAVLYRIDAPQPIVLYDLRGLRSSQRLGAEYTTPIPR
jgi:hypothetical protein